MVGSQCAAMFRGGREREENKTKGSVQVRLSRHVEPGQLCPLLLQLLQGCPLVNGSAASSEGTGLAGGREVCCRSGLVGIAWYG